MSLDAGKRRIYCDSRDCGEGLPVPILTKPRSERTGSKDLRSSAAGWVFVTGSDEVRHYCPDCRSRVLASRR